ncbi:MAG TPA: bifunctional methylenetetrahydrofolate dehydrogenase/methenyltetrahydrofolate cyclohydrolase FolD [Sandaracinaceae bacterium LLY-WYZ-13_1]|nr:bifunctional methylenetetrahydrofolate dehydrogenase/methenyltetrahydrofolate cyclohydrolase FolD [Sandaracinaceae bacterium LLY-WYZ-13_1]
MSAQILNGREVAKKVRAEVAASAASFHETHGREPGLEVVLVGDDPGSQVYVRNKERMAGKTGIRGAVHRLPATTTQDELNALLDRLHDDDTVDGVLVQLPLPGDLDELKTTDRIHPSKDVDGLHPLNAGLLAVGRPGLRPCTPRGCMRLLEETGLELSGKRALVLGRSNLVGKPVAQMLLRASCTVTIAHSRTRDLAERVRESDVVIAAVGRPKMVQGDWIKEGAVVIDVGINRLDDGSLCGDVDFDAAAERAAWITPVPKGVGPMTIAMLLSNTVDAAWHRAEG